MELLVNALETPRKSKQQVGTRVTGPLVAALLMVAVLVMTGCAGLLTNSVPQAGKITVKITPLNISFGKVVVGNKSSQTITVTNQGNSAITISQVTSTNPQFAITGVSLPLTLAVGQSSTFNVWISGTSSGTQNGTLNLQFSGAKGASSTTPVPLTANELPSQPQLVLSSSSVAFGKVTTGTTDNSSVTLSNVGNADLSIATIVASGAGFGVSGVSTPKVISAGQSANLNISYTPAANGDNSGSVTVVSNDTTNPTQVVSLTGTGTAAAVGTLRWNPTTLSLGNVAVGSSGTASATVTNAGQAAVHITQVNTTGSGFSATGLAAGTLNAGQSATVQVKYAPTSAGASSGSVTIVSDAQNSPSAVSLSGTGVQAGLSVSPASLSFGSLVDGNTDAKTITLTNTGSASLTVAQISESGNGFSISGLSAGSTIAAGQSANVTATFAPTTAGNFSGSITVASNAPNSPATIALSGSGTASTATVTASPNSLSFGNVSDGSSASQNVVLKNTGNSSATISQIFATGAGISITGTSTPLNLSAGQTVTIAVKFAPTSAGSVNGSVTVTPSQGSGINVAVSGTGTAAGLSATPSSVSFGNVVDGSANTQTVQLKNTGNASLTISQASVSGGGFSNVDLAVPATIAAGGTLTFNVKFAPTTAGAASGTMTLTSNAASSPSSLGMSGTGVASSTSLTTNPSSLSFGNVNDGTTSSKTVTLTNNGNANVTVNSVSASGTGFAASGSGLPTTLAPSQSLTVSVQFDPKSAGNANGTLSVSSTASGSPNSVALSGTGVAQTQHSAALSWTPSTSQVSGYNVYRGAQSGGPYTLINSGLVGGANFTDTTVQSGTNYFYVATAVDSTGAESSYSTEVEAQVP